MGFFVVRKEEQLGVYAPSLRSPTSQLEMLARSGARGFVLVEAPSCRGGRAPERGGRQAGASGGTEEPQGLVTARMATTGG